MLVVPESERFVVCTPAEPMATVPKFKAPDVMERLGATSVERADGADCVGGGNCWD